MTRFKNSALFASVVALGLSGAAVAQDAAPGSGAPSNATQDDTGQPETMPITVIDRTGTSTELFGPSTGGAGPMGGWTVYSSDNAVLGTVVNAAVNAERVVDYVIFELPNGNRVQMDATGIASVGEDSLVIAVSESEVLSKATEPMTALEFTDTSAALENAAEAKGEAVAAEPLTETNEPAPAATN